MDKKIEELAAFLKSGSKIHIKKSQRGSFTRYCNGKVTSECIRRGKNSPDPRIRKKATFAANARKWKHAEGGIINKYASGNNLVYKPFTEQTENDGSKYKPFIPDTIQDIVSDWTPQFPVEPVRNYTPVEQAPVKTVKTPEFEIEQVTAPRDAVVVSKPSEKMATNGKIYKSSEKQAFKADVYNTYVKALVKRGLDDITANKFAQRLTTQDILESRWGQSTLSQYYNFGGIKDFRKDGNAAVLDTTEYENGQKKTVKQPFRKFNSLEDYINYKIDLVDKNWNVFNDTPENYFLNITKGSRKYATDPKYAEKLNASNKQIWN